MLFTLSDTFSKFKLSEKILKSFPYKQCIPCVTYGIVLLFRWSRPGQGFCPINRIYESVRSFWNCAFEHTHRTMEGFGCFGCLIRNESHIKIRIEYDNLPVLQRLNELWKHFLKRWRALYVPWGDAVEWLCLRPYFIGLRLNKRIHDNLAGFIYDSYLKNLIIEMQSGRLKIQKYLLAH